MGFAYDSEMREEVEDRRLWKYHTLDEPDLRYIVHGLFGKEVIIN